MHYCASIRIDSHHVVVIENVVELSAGNNNPAGTSLIIVVGTAM